MGVWNQFLVHIFNIFFYKNFSNIILCQLTKLQYQTFFTSQILNNSCFQIPVQTHDDVINFNINNIQYKQYPVSFSYEFSNGWQGKKKRRGKRRAPSVNSITEETLKPTEHKTGFQKIYASVVQGTNDTNNNVSIAHKSKNTKAKNEFQIILKTLNPNKQPQSRGKLPSRTTSKTRQEPSPRDKEIENLKSEIRTLKQSQTNSITEDNPKNVQIASTPGGQATNNTEIINVLIFIQQTMETLSEYNEQLKGKLDINLTHQEML